MGLDKFLELVFGALLADRASKLLLRLFSMYLLIIILVVLAPSSFIFFQNEVIKLIIDATLILGIYVFSFASIIILGRYFISNAIVSLSGRQNSSKKSLRQLESLVSAFITWWILFSIPSAATAFGVIGLILLILFSLAKEEFSANKENPDSSLPFDV